MLENIALKAFLKKGRKTSFKKAQKLLEYLDILEIANRIPSQVSGGQKQKVAIARALINNPKLVLADEPTGNLDKQNSLALYELILDLNKKFNQTFIIVTHNEMMASKAKRVVELEDGTIKSNMNNAISK